MIKAYRPLADGRAWLMLAMLVAASLLAACNQQKLEFGFEVKGLETRISGQNLLISLEQKVSLSPEARRALENGVPLYIEVVADLEKAGGQFSISRQFEIRYMPLSDHYQLHSGQPLFVKTYPRLRHALADLSVVQLKLPIQDLPAGDYQLRARSYLEKQKLPAPMRLPAWFSPNWQHDTGWTRWPVLVPPRS